MKQPEAYGCFEKRGKYEYRTSAYLQWGTSEKSLGACLMMNPGGGALHPSLAEALGRDGRASGPVHALDRTMKQVCSIIEAIYGSDIQLNGRVFLYNVCSLRHSKMNHAVKEMERLAASGEYNPMSVLCDREELAAHPWIAIGWGLSANSKWRHLQQAKRGWLQLIKETGIPAFGKKNEQTGDYYHLCPQKHADQQTIVKELFDIYQQVMPKPPRRYKPLKWNGKHRYEAKFIIEDSESSLQSVFIPGRTSDMVWFSADLASDPMLKEWEDFGESRIQELEHILCGEKVEFLLV